MIGLEHEILVDLRSLCLKEAANLLYLGVFGKKLLILSLVSVLRIVSHKELS